MSSEKNDGTKKMTNTLNLFCGTSKMGSIFSVNKTVDKCETKKDHLLVVEPLKEKPKKKEECNLRKAKRNFGLTRL